MSHSFKAACLSALAITSQLVWAQATVHRTVSDPLDANAPIPKAVYQSAFMDYQSWTDEPMQAWRQANDEVGQSGGHAGHNISKGEAASSTTQQPTAPKPMDHANHPMK